MAIKDPAGKHQHKIERGRNYAKPVSSPHRLNGGPRSSATPPSPTATQGLLLSCGPHGTSTLGVGATLNAKSPRAHVRHAGTLRSLARAALLLGLGLLMAGCNSVGQRPQSTPDNSTSEASSSTDLSVLASYRDLLKQASDFGVCYISDSIPSLDNLPSEVTCYRAEWGEWENPPGGVNLYVYPDGLGPTKADWCTYGSAAEMNEVVVGPSFVAIGFEEGTDYAEWPNGLKASDVQLVLGGDVQVLRDWC